MLDASIGFATGPGFRIALAVLVLGLIYRFAVLAGQLYVARRTAGDRSLPLAALASATLNWVFPRRLLRARPLYSVASFVAHLGLVVVPLLLAGHKGLLGAYLPAAWPTLPQGVADGLTIAALVGFAVLFGGRIASRTARQITRVSDLVIVGLLFALVGFGYLAAHPTLVPLDARVSLLLHALLGNLVLVMIPTTRLAHCVLFPIAQLVFEVGWHFPARTGDHVAQALGKEGEPV